MPFSSPLKNHLKFNYFAMFAAISILAAAFLYFDLAPNNAYDLLSRSANVSRASAALEASFKQAEFAAREHSLYGKSIISIPEARQNVWRNFKILEGLVFDHDLKEKLGIVRQTIETRFVSQDELIKIYNNAGPQAVEAAIRKTGYMEDVRRVSEANLALQIEQSEILTRRAAAANADRNYFRLYAAITFALLYGVWTVSFFLNSRADKVLRATIWRVNKLYVRASRDFMESTDTELSNEIEAFLSENREYIASQAAAKGATG